MKRRKPSCKKGSLKGIQTPKSEKAENVDESSDVVESECEDHEIHGEFDATAQQYWEVNKKLPLKMDEEEDIKEESKHGKGAAPAQNYHWDNDRQMLFGTFKEEDKKEEWEYEKKDLSNVPGYKSVLFPLVEDIPPLEDVEMVTSIVHPQSPTEIVADVEHEENDDSEGSYTGTTDSSAESSIDAVWPEEMLTEAINNIKPISMLLSENVEQACNGTPSYVTNNSIHLNRNYNDSVSSYWKRMATHSTRIVTVLRILLAVMLVLIYCSFLARHMERSPLKSDRTLVI